MSNATELLRRVVNNLDEHGDIFCGTLDDIRTFLAAEPEAEPTKIEIEAERQDIDWQSNEGAVYLFAGWLTTRDKVISCGRTENAAPMAEAIKEYKAEWPKRFAKPEPAIRKPMTEEEIKKETSEGESWFGDNWGKGFKQGVRFAEKHHGIGINPSNPDSIDLQSRCRGDKL